jgi:phospholipase C
MLENRSFDHFFGSLKQTDPRVDGLTGMEFNLSDPAFPGSPQFRVQRSTSAAMSFDPNHEFLDVQFQLYVAAPPNREYQPSGPADMGGFLRNALHTPGGVGNPVQVLEYFEPDQLPVLSTLAREFALFNYWHCPLPGPTWPNRFFIHAATSGGLSDSPTEFGILAGFEFKNGTIYDHLEKARKRWRIYHDGLPQAAGIRSLRDDLLDFTTDNFSSMDKFWKDVKKGKLPDYTFIEPAYDTGNQYIQGNSMHPLNDVREGEKLIKRVYESLRGSALWDKTMLIITFDEHGGFYDHVPPPPGLPTGDDREYATPQRPFSFDRLGVRVPAIVISAYTEKGTVIGATPADAASIFDHSSILATVARRFGLPFLSSRDRAANTLEVALNRATGRLSGDEAPLRLPNPASSEAFPPTARALVTREMGAPAPQQVSKNQRSMVALAHALNLEMVSQNKHSELHNRYRKIHTPAEAAVYVAEVEKKLRSKQKK